jgi:multidrug efflux pump subunit AcrA (membrane-fusion protein)
MSDPTSLSGGDTDSPHPLLAPPQPRRRTALWVTLGVVVVAGVAIWQAFARFAPATATTTTQPLSTAAIKAQDLTETTKLSGTLEFENPVAAGSPGAGYVVSVPTEGDVLHRGDIIAMVADNVTDDQVLQAQQRVLSAQAGLNNATTQYHNTVDAASQADIAGAQVALTKATDAYNALFDEPSDADLAAARAQVAKTQAAYQALLDGPTDQQLSDAQLAVDRANAGLEQARTTKGLALFDLQSAQATYCALPTVPVNVCNDDDIPLSSYERAALVTAVDDFNEAGDGASAATTRAFLDADAAYNNAVVSFDSAAATQRNAVQALADLKDGASDADMEQALADMYSAQDRLDTLLAGPTDAQIAAAEADKMAAQERLDTLEEGASAAQRASASDSLKNAKISLQLAQQDLASLVSGPKVVVLFYGPLQMWRTLSDGVTPGADVQQLETNLLALGFDDDGAMVVDDTFDEATAAAVSAWQQSLGVEATGVVDLGTIRYVDGPSQATTVNVTVGDAVNASTPVAQLTPIERVIDTVNQPTTTDTTDNTTTTDDTTTTTTTALDTTTTTTTPADTPSGDETETTVTGVTETVETTQRITSQIDVSDRSILEIGMPVTVVLPDDSEIDATVESIGDVAITQTSQSGSSSVVDVTFVPSQSVDAVWTGADVEIDVVTSLTKNALTVPVTALLALREGGYAVQVVNDDGTTTLVGVETGTFTDSYVEITGEGLQAGMQVVVP